MEEKERKKEKKKITEMQLRAHRDQRIGLVPGATRIPAWDPPDRELSGLDEILFVIRSYLVFFFFTHIDVRDRWIDCAAAPQFYDRASACLDPDSRRSISFVVSGDDLAVVK